MATEPLVVQAIYPFKGSNNDELCFKKGDLITVTQKDDGWWEGTFNGKTGWFPSNYVKESKDAPKPVVVQQNQYKSVVLKDLIDSEKAHVTELESLVTNFLQPLEKSAILTNDEYKQLTGNIAEVLDTHQQLLKLMEAEQAKPGLEQRVGRLFLTWARRIKAVNQAYCAHHPKAACILDQYKEELTKYMESRGATSPGVLVLTVLLSKPFRRLDKYSGMLQELERHVEECHPDRGDTQRSVAVYKDIATTCAATRRQKELELQVLTGPVRGWEGPSLTALGDIIFMGSVAVGPQHHDRYFVLFPTTLLILSVSHRLSAFIYEGKLPLSGLVVTRLEDNEQYKNAFEISAPMIEKKIAVCQSKNEANYWVELLRKHMPKNATSNNQKVAPSQAQFVPQPPPHLNQRGYSTRASVLCYQTPVEYDPRYPPETYPPCAPYASLTKYFSKCIKDKQITRKLLKQLLYPEYLNRMNLATVRIRHHKTECVIITKSVQCRISVINCDSDSDSDSDITLIKRQNAIVESGSSGSSSSNPFGYIRYYNPQTNEIATKYESFVDYGDVQTEPKIELIKQASENSEASSGIVPKAFGACEDLVNLDGSISRDTLDVPKRYVPLERQSCPTKLVGNKFSSSSLTTIYIPGWSNSDTNITRRINYDLEENDDSTTTHSSSLELPLNTVPLPDKVVAELLYNFDSDESDPPSAQTVIKPPTMFANQFQKPFSITRRRSSIQINPQDLKPVRRCVSSKYLRMSPSYCRGCTECHSPRSSDSGMAGSCTLNSPNSVQESNRGITLSEFEAQCPCTSPFGSTPRTSEPSVSGNSLRTSVTSFDMCPWPKMHSKEEGPIKSKSMGCVLDEGVEQGEEEVPIYKSGLYAHWWLKAKIPASVLRGIYEETRAGKGTSPLVAAGSAPSPPRPTTNSPPPPPPHGRGWSATSLRPSPPLRPCLAFGHVPYSRPGPRLSYKEDGLILDVIEAYFSTVKPRNTVNSVDLLTGGNVRMHDKLARSHRSSVDLSRSSSAVAQPLQPRNYRPHAPRASTWCCGSFVVRQLRKTQHLE
ncbi:Rho guanine nucleotide exchange factor 7-like Protein [Tribolium castaneum]|uniref:Rho guanine nucleotide exchange factor 7-like Protein n=1 Tax=Tribolium castaneum TaxID=7070 RepID=A0A139WHJ2_TRICA|nr:Rho guanine nucleotide exchange factor 7-like Protein [Tribolium castaneum]